MKKIFTLLFVALMGMSFSMRAQEATPNAIYPAFTAEDEDWTPNLLVDEPITVENYDDYLIIKAWLGGNGYGLKVTYDDDENITSITPITDGEEGATVTSGYSGWLNTGNDEWYSANFYVGTGYGYATSSEDEGGYAIITVYAASEEYPNGEKFYYYLWWNQSQEQIQTAAMEDIEGLAALVELPGLTMDALDEADPDGEPTELYIAAGNLIAKAMDLFNLVNDATQTAMTETGSYESPITEEASEELDTLWTEYEDLLLADYNDDIELLQDVWEIISSIQNSETFEAFAKVNDDEIVDLIAQYTAANDAVQTAYEDTMELGLYVSPTKVMTEVVNAAMGLNSKFTEDEMAINNAYDKDEKALKAYRAVVKPALDGTEENVTEERKAAAEKVDDLIDDALIACRDAREEAFEETAKYVSPLTEQMIADIEDALKAFATTGINGIAIDGNAARYFDINGIEVANPAAGKVYIRVAGGKAVKVIK